VVHRNAPILGDGNQADTQTFIDEQPVIHRDVPAGSGIRRQSGP
jgi:hypothetical protein